VVGGRVNGGDEGEGTWLTGFIYIYMKQNNEISCNCFKWNREEVGVGKGEGREGGGDLTNVEMAQ
jgi:hypothetical protein